MMDVIAIKSAVGGLKVTLDLANGLAGLRTALEVAKR